MESIRCIKSIKKEKKKQKKKNKLSLNRNHSTFAGFVPVQVFSKSQTLRFVFAFSFLCYLTCRQSFPSRVRFKAFTCSKNQNNRANIFRTASVTRCNCCEDLLHQAQVAKNFFVLVFPCFVHVNSSCSGFFETFTCLIQNNLANIF